MGFGTEEMVGRKGDGYVVLKTKTPGNLQRKVQNLIQTNLTIRMIPRMEQSMQPNIQVIF